MTKLKPCQHCQNLFAPVRPLQAVCSPRCAMAKVRQDKQADKAQTRQRKAALKTNGERKADAQRALNHWIVHVRDKDQPCISCGRHHQGANHAGHYRSRGSAPHLALDPRNVAKQCSVCSLYLHGNLIGFRAGLIHRHGEAFVTELEADNTPRHLTAHELDEIKREYRALAREAKKENA